MRQDGGRPSAGMRPRVTREDGRQIAPAVTVLLVETEPEAMTDMFRHVVRKSQDPRQRYEEGLRVLASTFYQFPENFSDLIASLFSVESEVAALLVRESHCVLHFEQSRQSYHIPCLVEELGEDAAAYQATYWHNRLFNPTLPSQVRLLAFYPDWTHARAAPPVL